MWQQEETYVHGIVKKIWIGILSASATWVCPKDVSMSMAKYNKDMHQTVIFTNLIRQAQRKDQVVRKVKER